MKCEHLNFRAMVKVGRLSKEEGGPIKNYMADITICCSDCGLPFQFLGLEPGVDLQGARVSIDNLEAHLGICPQGSQPNHLDNIAVNFNLRPKLNG